ncbi:hypothetical protein B0J12DRAFT_547221, partial [Macrophomina phaseolina]
SQYKDLVVVACHAIFVGNPEASDCDIYSPLQWNLQSFQQPCGSKPGEHETFLRHIQAGLDILSFGAIKESSILVFSGGYTASHIKLSEARSYYNAAVACTRASARAESCAKLLGSRILLEEHATDSFQNLLFSILLFRKTIGTYPETITVITHAFKTERFLLSHAKAIRWPQGCIRVQGLNPVMSADEYQETLNGERRAFDSWKEDLYGTHPPLSSKRVQRGWQEETINEVGDGLEMGVKDLL